MSENQNRILQLLAEGKISVEEASRLLSLVSEEHKPGGVGTAETKETKPMPKYLYIKVEPKSGCPHNVDHEVCNSTKKHERVNIRIPMELMRAGIKLKALIPPNVADDINKSMREKGISFDIRDLKDEYLEGLIMALTQTEINVDTDEAEVRIYAE